NDTGVLHVRAFLELDSAEIPPQTGERANIYARADDDVANEDRGGMHVGRRMDHGNDAVDGINFEHAAGLRDFYTWLRNGCSIYQRACLVDKAFQSGLGNEVRTRPLPPP